MLITLLHEAINFIVKIIGPTREACGAQFRCIQDDNKACVSVINFTNSYNASITTP